MILPSSAHANLHRRTKHAATVKITTTTLSSLLNIVYVFIGFTLIVYGVVLTKINYRILTTNDDPIALDHHRRQYYYANKRRRQQHDHQPEQQHTSQDNNTHHHPTNMTNMTSSLSFPPHIFVPWNGTHDDLCYEPEAHWPTLRVQNTPTDRGLFYLKPYKTGSSTASGVTLRIARNIAKRQQHHQQQYAICRSRFDHGPDYIPGRTLYRNRHKNRSFLWTTIRHPTSRVLSLFYFFTVSRRRKPPTLASFQYYIRYNRYRFQDYYFSLLHPNGTFHRTTDHDKKRNRYSSRKFMRQQQQEQEETIGDDHHNDQRNNETSLTLAATIIDDERAMRYVHDIYEHYNFIGITERMDESIVVLMMLLNVSMSDILYLSAKTSGGYDDASGGKGKCTYIQKTIPKDFIDDYFVTYEWQNRIRYDIAFYHAINRSLDDTIDALGRDQFDQYYRKFIYVQKIANERCYPTAVFPCDSNGTYHPPSETDCIWNDSGCATKCLDQIATEYQLW